MSQTAYQWLVSIADTLRALERDMLLHAHRVGPEHIEDWRADLEQQSHRLDALSRSLTTRRPEPKEEP